MLRRFSTRKGSSDVSGWVLVTLPGLGEIWSRNGLHRPARLWMESTSEPVAHRDVKEQYKQCIKIEREGLKPHIQLACLISVVAGASEVVVRGGSAWSGFDIMSQVSCLACSVVCFSLSGQSAKAALLSKLRSIFEAAPRLKLRKQCGWEGRCRA